MRNKFIQMAIAYQNDASTPEEAKRAFNISCQICSNRGIKLDCGKCPVSIHHNLVMAVFEDLEKYKRMKKKG